MPAAGFALGVDLGTSNTVAVLRWPDGRTKPLLFDGSPLLPSAVYAEPDPAGSHRRAAHRPRRGTHGAGGSGPLRAQPEAPDRRGQRAARRARGAGGRPAGGGADPGVRRGHPDHRWTAARGDHADLPGRLGGDPARGAHLGGCQGRSATGADGGGAGRRGHLLRPVLGRQVPIGSVVVVHDFGAGTFDASVVARHATGFEVLAVDGRSDIGGLDIDAAIVAHFGTLYAERDPAAWQRLTAPTTLEDRRHRRHAVGGRLRGEGAAVPAQAADLVIPLLNADVHLTREELERLALPMLEQDRRGHPGRDELGPAGAGPGGRGVPGGRVEPDPVGGHPAAPQPRRAAGGDRAARAGGRRGQPVRGCGAADQPVRHGLLESGPRPPSLRRPTTSRSPATRSPPSRSPVTRSRASRYRPTRVIRPARLGPARLGPAGRRASPSRASRTGRPSRVSRSRVSRRAPRPGRASRPGGWRCRMPGRHPGGRPGRRP